MPSGVTRSFFLELQTQLAAQFESLRSSLVNDNLGSA